MEKTWAKHQFTHLVSSWDCVSELGKDGIRVSVDDAATLETLRLKAVGPLKTRETQ